MLRELAEMTDGCFHCYNSSSEVFTANFFRCIFKGFDVICIPSATAAAAVAYYYYNHFTASGFYPG